MFRKLKVALGAGSATVDTVLSTDAVRPGDRVQGVVHVGGGEIEQEVERVTVALQTVVEVESGDSEWSSTQTFASTHVADGLVLQPGDAHEFPFYLQVPWETPLTHISGQRLRGVNVGVRTELAVAKAVDRGDLDPVEIHPLPGQQGLLDALLGLGFDYKGADVEQGTLRGASLPFFQEIEFYAGGRWRGRFNELEVTFLGGPHATRVVFEADMRGGWFSEGADAYSWFEIPTAGGGTIPGIVEQQLHALGQRRGW
ncbi:sporulation protein [Solirubrobacter soli]|uniref:sporulation protein n=1 Tax=Solirubrobacter soli TaxID=363832 RepID=UPI0004057530|nr:sporulation protein [Solirubrobacter soli]